MQVSTATPTVPRRAFGTCPCVIERYLRTFQLTELHGFENLDFISQRLGFWSLKYTSWNTKKEKRSQCAVTPIADCSSQTPFTSAFLHGLAAQPLVQVLGIQNKTFVTHRVQTSKNTQHPVIESLHGWLRGREHAHTGYLCRITSNNPLLEWNAARWTQLQAVQNWIGQP